MTNLAKCLGFNLADSFPGDLKLFTDLLEGAGITITQPKAKLDDLPFSIRMPKARTDTGDFNVEMSLEDVEKGHILRALAYNHGNKTKTAQSLGITIKTLYNKLHRYGILTPQAQSGPSADSVQI